MTARIAAVRRRSPLLDHAVRTQEHYSAVKAGQQAGAVTYFAFLSFFPVLALAFFVVGLVARVYEGARDALADALDAIMPGLLGTQEGQATLDDIEKFAGTVGLVGAIVLLYSGLGWVSAMRAALVVVFELPVREHLNFVLGKVRDLVMLVVIGAILLVGVGVAGLVGGFSTQILDRLDLDVERGWLLRLLAILLGVLVGLALFYALFVLLARPHTPRRSLWSGALLGALAFEVLKQISGLLISLTQGSPAFQAFGIALVVLVWINYFSKVVLYAASWAHTSAAARAARPAPAPPPIEGPPSPPVRPEPEHPWAWPFAAGAGLMLGLVSVVRRVSGRAAGRRAGPS
nr:YhjD/YihY/BrkB family envelope integrity protein [Nocardioides sp. MAH-18]